MDQQVPFYSPEVSLSYSHLQVGPHGMCGSDDMLQHASNQYTHQAQLDSWQHSCQLVIGRIPVEFSKDCTDKIHSYRNLDFSWMLLCM